MARNFGINNFHPLVEMKEPPQEIVELRTELQHPSNLTIVQAAMKGKDFADSMGIIAKMVGLELDGSYDVPTLCGLILTELKKKRNSLH